MVAKLLVVGGGRMGEALIKGLLRSGWAQPGDLVVSEASELRRADLGADPGLAGARVVAQLPDGEGSEGAVIAVKPQDVRGACQALPGGMRRVLSIAAGVRLCDHEKWCPETAAVLRAMPNTPALVGAAATALSPGSAAGREDVGWASGLLKSVGSVVEVPEQQLDAVTGLSGSGPAYLFVVVEALTEAGVLAGLPRPVAAHLAAQTLFGSGRLLVESGEPPEALRAAVTSPGGTTAAGLRQLERGGVRAAFMEAVAAAVQRSRELAEGKPAV